MTWRRPYLRYKGKRAFRFHTSYLRYDGKHVFHIYIHSFRFAQAQNVMKMVCLGLFFSL